MKLAGERLGQERELPRGLEAEHRLAAEARAGPLLRAVQAKRAELKELILKALHEKKQEGGDDNEDDPDELVLGLLSVWVDEVPEYGEELLARHRSSLSRRGRDKRARQDAQEPEERDNSNGTGEVVGLAQDDSPLATGMTALLLATTSH